VGAFVPTRAAHDLVDEAYSEFAEGNEYIRGCRRFGRRRVDCIIGIHRDEITSPQRCALGVSVVLRRTGYVMQRRYRCGRARNAYFSGRPAWTRAAVQAPDLDSID